MATSFIFLMIGIAYLAASDIRARLTLLDYVAFSMLIFGTHAVPRLTRKSSRTLYSLDHARLNVKVPPASMWMNMGYWDIQFLRRSRGYFEGAAITSLYTAASGTMQKEYIDLPLACEALLVKVLECAGLMKLGDRGKQGEVAPFILDLGCGCGNQSALVLSNMWHMQERPKGASQALPKIGLDETARTLRLSVAGYVGLTNERRQYEYAKQLLHGHVANDPSGHQAIVTVELEDAADPASWSHSLKSTLEEQMKQGLRTRETSPSSNNWMLALDSLYHFKPSRSAVLRYGCRELRASLMAFDLILADDTATLDLYILRLVTALMGVPFANFVTEVKYRQMLVDAGYAEDHIQIEDISEHVFAPLVNFFDRQDRNLIDIGTSIGKFRAAKWLFNWWARSGVVRGCIVIAKSRVPDNPS